MHDHATDQGYDPDLDEHGHDINRPLDDEETAALHRLDSGQGWLDQNPPTPHHPESST
ncbi:hypothetical protein [Nocardiopsis alkaliphila]|mgnify:CR=1 FL=1|uniref:hypothetical protein n=1 Tax=Nocardiopsis alkaliphila TaxID=225762 RepID=UPI000344C090|nr:hypothetical protein [Nocardiopsis alkaliphila]